jgi:hypothetical protein
MAASSLFLAEEATQPRSKVESPVEQGQLPLSRAERNVEVPLAAIIARKSLLGAINLCIDMSGEEDKELYISLDIDPGHWSNLRKGKGHFPPDKIDALMDLCGNEVPMLWQVHKRGYDTHSLRKRESETEQALRQEREKRIEAEKALAAVVSAMAGRQVA